MNSISIHNLTHTIEDRTILKNISLSIPKGQCVMITGHNGSGKSTLLKLIQEGHPDIDKAGKSVILHQNINDNLFCGLTILENFQLFCGKRSVNKIYSTIQQYLSRFKSKPSPYTTVSRLSGGERQRLALYMRLMMKSDILLLDEFTSALDPETTLLLMDEVIDLTKEQNMTVILVTHDLSLIKSRSGFMRVEIENGKLFH